MADSQQIHNRESQAKAALPLERYAEILAHLMHFGSAQSEEVLRRFGYGRAEWDLADTAWILELSLGVKRQQRDQALRFSATLAKVRQKLLRTMPSIDAIGRADAIAKVAEPIQEGSNPVVKEQAPVFMSMGSASLDSVTGRSPWVVHAAPPQPPAAPSPAVPQTPSVSVVSAPPPLPAAAPAVPGQGQTADISAFVPRELLPFQQAPQAPQAPRPPTPEAVAAPPAEIKGKRLIRFNPQTGQMLDQPIWVDIPETNDQNAPKKNG